MSAIYSPLAEQFAACLKRLHPDAPEALLETAKQVSEAVGQGHVCVDFAFDADSAVPAASTIIGPVGSRTPLIFDGQRLYLARYWHYETRLAQNLLSRAAFCEAVDLPKLRQDLAGLFAPLLPVFTTKYTKITKKGSVIGGKPQQRKSAAPDWQKAAAAAAVLRRFCVISGGPGTGKTSTVIRILAALQSQADGRLRIGLAAPTGKAAARMQDAVRSAKQSLAFAPALVAAIPETAVTLHRLLGSRPNSVYFRHNAENPLPLDVLVVDEASMIDLALMAKLLDALPAACRLILLGDKDQLASVEAGSVFGDICASGAFTGGQGGDFCPLLPEGEGAVVLNSTALGGEGGLKKAGCDHAQYSAAFRQKLAAVGVVLEEEEAGAWERGESEEREQPLADSILLLRHSHRFAADSGIGALARLCNQGQAEQALALLLENQEGIVWRQGRYEQFKDDLLKRMLQGYAEYFSAVAAADPAAVFAAFNRFRVLTAHRDGDCGAENLNRLLEERIKARQNLHYRNIWYPGRAVMIACNDYNLRLFNGDIGIALPSDGQLRVYFEDADGHVRGLAPARLPEHQPVYAMTVHKSQGSEFAQVLLLLPDAASAVLNRPLIYTAITRARQAVELWGSAEVLQQALAKTPARSSGLRERLRSGL